MNKIFDEGIETFEISSKKDLLTFNLIMYVDAYIMLHGDAATDTPEGEYRRCLVSDVDKILERINNASSIEELEVLDKEIEEVRKELF